MKFVAAVLIGLIVPATAEAQRLPLIAVPNHYALRFTPDLERERFTAEATIDVTVLAPTTRFVVNAAELSITNAAVIAEGRRQTATVTLDPASETLTMTIPEAVPAGPAELHFEYAGVLNRALRGFYISEAAGRTYAVTQLEATDARRMFPSFDEPALKATFAISVAVPQDQEAISNAPVVMITDGPGPGRKTIRFDTTARMSTYLVALAVGDFECVEDQVDHIPLRVCASPGQVELMTFALDTTKTLLLWFNEYFTIDYPFAKLDLVAIPDFAAGAMENTGAIFFREALVLVAPDAPLATRTRAALVIAHEMAHQWFGDLVTMKWWDDIWLNEGFATWMETKAVAAWKPEWGVKEEQLRSTHSAMAIDALAATRSIRTKADTPAEINELFDPIAYAKAAAVLGMLEAFAGEASFRSAINAYLERFKYESAQGEDFWRLAARATGKPLDAVMASFVSQPGVPIVSLAKSCVDDRTHLRVTQDRFPGNEAGAAPLWSIPVCLETAEPGESNRCVVTAKREMTIELPGCVPWVMGNDDATGYYRTRYSSGSLSELEPAVNALGTRERLATIADEWALARAGRADVDGFLGLAASLAPESQSASVLEAVADRLQFVHEYLTTPGDRERFESWVRAEYRPALRHVMQQSFDDANEVRRAAALLRLVGGIGRAGDVLEDATNRVRAYLADPGTADIETGLLSTVVGLAALGGDAALWGRYRQRAVSATVPEERYRFLYALAAFRDPALLQRTLEFAMSSDVRAQDRALLISAVLDNPAGREPAWGAIQTNWSALQAGLGAFGGLRRIVDSLSAFCDEAHLQDVRGFFETHPVDGVDRTLQQTLDEIGRCRDFRDRQGAVLASWIAQRDAEPIERPATAIPPPRIQER